MEQKADKIQHGDGKLDWRADSGVKVESGLDFAQIMNTIGQGVLITGEGWRFEYVNPAFARIVGKPIADLIGKTMDEFIVPEDLPLLNQQRSKRLAGEPSTYEFRLRRSDGEIVYVHATGVPRRLGDNVVGSISVVTDMTVKKKAEEALKAERKETEEKNLQLVAIVESSNDAIFGTTDGTIMSWNKGAEIIYGYTEDEIVGQPVTLLASPERQDEVPQILEKLRQGEHICHHESLCRRKDGKQFPVDLTISPVYDTKNRIVGLSSIARDITERKLAEEALKAERDRTEKYLNIVGVIFIVLDTNARIILLNRKGYEILGYEEGELTGKSWIKTCLRLEDYERVLDFNNKIVAGKIEPLEYYENYILTKKGEERNIAWHTAVLKDDEGHIIGTLSSGDDITKRKQAEKALIASEEKFRRAFTNSPNIVCLSTLADGIYIDVNENFERILGWSRDEVIGHSSRELGIFQDYSKRHEILGFIELNGCVNNYGLNLKTKSRETKICEGSAEIVDVGGQKCLLFQVNDITERKRAEEEIRTLAKFQEENPNPVLRVTSEGVLSFANPCSASLLKLWDCQVGQRIPKELRELVLSAFTSDEIRKIDVVCGKVIYSLMIVPIRDVGHVNIYGMDITERKRTEEALRNSEERYRAFFSTSRDCAFSTSVDGRWVDFNDATVQIFGYDSREDIMNAKIKDLYANPDDRISHLQVINKKGYTEEYPVALRKKDGTIIDTLITTVTRKDSIGTIIGYQGTVQDITERKRAEEALHESEGRFRRLAENAPDVVFRFEILPEPYISYISPAVTSYLGYTPEDFYANPELGFKLVHPDDLPQFNSLTKGEIPSNTFFIIRWLSKNGTYIWAEHLSMPVFNNFGNLVAVESIGRDITERKKVEDALKNSEQEKAAVLSGLKNGSVEYLDPQMRIIWVNEAVQESLGLSVKEMQGKYCFELIEGLKAPCPGCTAVTACKTGEPQVGELVTPDGKTWISCSNPLKDSMGQVTGVVHVAINITDRKRAEEELRRAQSRIRIAMDLVKLVRWEYDVETDMFTFDDQFYALYGTTAEREGGLLMSSQDYARKFIPAEDASIVAKEVSKALATTDPNFTSQVEHRIIRADGTEGVIAVRFAITKDDKGRTIRTYGANQDITERKQMERELRRSRDELELRVKERTEELARKNAEMERFIYTVSHDLRSPLISMNGFLGFIEQDAQKGDLDRLKNDLRIVSDSVSQMDRLLQSTLELSRIGRVISPPEDLPFREIIGDALSQIDEKIKSKEVKVSIAPDMPVVHVDRMRIVEVLANLIENSIKYMGTQEKPEIKFGHRIGGNERILFVRDNGMGVDPTEHAKVFELFYKVNKGSEGTGAGLAIVKRIIEVHGGRVWIESELGKGCTVCFTLAPAKPG